MANEDMTYVSAGGELERIVQEIETGAVDVDVLTVKVKRAAELIKFCKERLRTTQDDVSKILGTIEGEEKPES